MQFFCKQLLVTKMLSMCEFCHSNICFRPLDLAILIFHALTANLVTSVHGLTQEYHDDDVWNKTIFGAK